MYIRYEYRGFKGPAITQMRIDKFILFCFRDRHYVYGDDLRSEMEVKLDGTCELLCNMISMLVEKKFLTIEEFHEMLPKKNYTKLISFDEEWDEDL